MANARMSRRIGFGLLLAGVASIVGSGSAFAAGCLVGPAKATDVSVNEAVTNPDALLKSFPKGGVALTTKIRALVGSDSATLDPVLSVIPSASVAQASAIGSGLARAASACVKIDQTYAKLIGQKAHDANSPELLASFVSTSSDIQMASFGAVAGSDAAVATVVSVPSASQGTAAVAANVVAAPAGRVVTPTAALSGQLASSGDAITVESASNTGAPVNIASSANGPLTAGTSLDGDSAFTYPGSTIDVVSPH